MIEVEKLSAALAAANLTLTGFEPHRKRPVILDGKAYPYSQISKVLMERLSVNAPKHIEAISASEEDLAAAFDEIATQKGLTAETNEGNTVPAEMAKYTLNLDTSSDPIKFFVTNEEEKIDRSISGAVYMRRCGLREDEAVKLARGCVPKYMPRRGPGIVKLKNEAGVEVPFFNTYVRPEWMDHPNFSARNPKIPPLYKKLFEHLFPKASERKYFYAWLYKSLFDRAPTYLVLCGNPGIGKGVLKTVMRALHGHANSPEGKRSMFTDKFNSQQKNTTLLLFDEFRYDEKMENQLKEMQTRLTSVEEKGKDAERITEVYASFMLANNTPRDNYIKFDSRKFAPLEVTQRRLETSLTSKEIDHIVATTERMDNLDLASLAMLANWLKTHGPRYVEKDNMEYHGPMFYRLAHTSMAAWQAAAINFLKNNVSGGRPAGKVVYHKEHGYRWSTLVPYLKKGAGRYSPFPRNLTAMDFFNSFKDAKGRKSFETSIIPDSFDYDFYLKPLFDFAFKKEEPENEDLDL
jgi:Family of unknown function (DUF5906)